MAHSDKRILIVDDEETNRELLSDHLLEKNYHVANAESGPLAMALLPLFRPDLVLLDYDMPGMNGLEVLKRVKAWDENLDVIMIIGADSAGITQEAIEQGASDYLIKPFHWKQLDVLLGIYLVLQSKEEQ